MEKNNLANRAANVVKTKVETKDLDGFSQELIDRVNELYKASRG